MAQMYKVKYLGLVLLVQWLTCDARNGRGLQQAADPSNIKVSYRLDQAKTRRNPNTAATVQLSLKAAEASQRAPVVFNMVLDSSASMGTTQQFDIVKNTTDFVIDNLISQDYFGIVSFKDQAQELIRLELVQQQRGAYKELVNQLFASNDSNLAEGVLTGLEQHEQLPLQDNIIRGTIIVSDGDPNTGITDPEIVKSLIQTKFQSLDERVRLFTVATVGAKFNLLEDIANVGQGALLYLTRPEDLQKAFGLQFGGLISTYYQDVILNINAQPGVRIGKISTGGQVVDNENNVQVKFSDLRADEGRDLLVDLEFDDDGTEQLPENLIEITVEYLFQFTQGSLGGSFTVGSSEVVEDQDPLIDISVLRFEVTDLLNQSKTVSNTQEVQEVVNQAENLQRQFEDLKKGGMRQLLQDATPSQTLELGFGGTRKLLQTPQDLVSQSDEFFRLFESLNLTLVDTIDILRQINGFLDDDEDDVDENDLQRLFVTLDSLQFSLDLQRLEIVPTEEFAAVEAVGELLITPVQDALSRGIRFFEEESDDLFITLIIPPEYQEFLTLALP